MFGCCATTSLGLVYNQLNLKRNDTLLVVGIGGLGQVLLQGAKNFKLKKKKYIMIKIKKLIQSKNKIKKQENDRKKEKPGQAKKKPHRVDCHPRPWGYLCHRLAVRPLESIPAASIS